MAEKAVVWEPLETDPLLLDMALDRAGLVQAALFAQHERSFVTINDPIGFGSYVAYAKSGRALREWYLPKDKEWERDNSNNQVAIKHPKKMIRVVPCNFNEFAGDPFNTPTNKAPKGEISRKKSESNLITWLHGFEPPVIDPDLNDGYQTWLLGMYFDDIRPLGAELSLPIEFDGKQFKKFGRRIILIWSGADGGGSAVRKQVDDGGSGGSDAVGIVDIAIKRK
jgi:hypothetical protein